MDENFEEFKGRAKDFFKKNVVPGAKRVAGKVGRKLEEVSGEDALREILMAKKVALMKTGLTEDEAKNTLKRVVNRILSE